MGPFFGYKLPPAFDDDLGFAQGIEDLAVQQFIPLSAVEAFAISLRPAIGPPDRLLDGHSPGRTWLDVGRLGPSRRHSRSTRLSFTGQRECRKPHHNLFRLVPLVCHL